MFIQFDNRLPELSKLTHLLEASGNEEVGQPTLQTWTPVSAASDSTKYIAAYDSDLLVGIGRLDDSASPQQSDTSEIVVLPAYQNREINATISKLLRAKSYSGRSKAL